MMYQKKGIITKCSFRRLLASPTASKRGFSCSLPASKRAGSRVVFPVNSGLKSFSRCVSGSASMSFVPSLIRSVSLAGLRGKVFKAAKRTIDGAPLISSRQARGWVENTFPGMPRGERAF